jgi:hypothetical protein
LSKRGHQESATDDIVGAAMVITSAHASRSEASLGEISECPQKHRIR